MEVHALWRAKVRKDFRMNIVFPKMGWTNQLVDRSSLAIGVERRCLELGFGNSGKTARAATRTGNNGRSSGMEIV
jgi:hypothetical protein